MHKTKLTENLKNVLTARRDVDVVKDMPYKKDYACNSFFAIGHFDVKEHKLNYLYHIMTCEFPGQDPYVTYCFSVTDETTMEFYQYSHAYSFKEASVSEDTFSIKTPKGFMSGTLDDMHLKCDIDNASLNLHLTAIGYPLYNAETGKFILGGIEMYEYSIPTLLSNGTIRVGNNTYEIKDGISWYDRQWELKLPKAPKAVMNAASKIMAGRMGSTAFPTWGWMDLNLDNGDVISTWFALENVENCWATLMHPDGSHKMVNVNPMISTAKDYWKSQSSGHSYPMTYTIEIPELDANLTVKCAVKDQELFFPERPDLNHYEGAASITGTYLGKETNGYCYVELVGDWDQK